MTLVRGGLAGPNGAGGSYKNEVESDRTVLFYALGGRQGVMGGLTASAVPGQMALDLAAGAALVAERAADGSTTRRGYLVWADGTTRVTFGPASPAARSDTVIAAFVDTEDGPVGTGGLDVGAHLVVVPGTSGITTPTTDTAINAWLGRGGRVRLHDVPIASADTQINTSAMSAVRAFLLNSFNPLVGVTAASGWTIVGTPTYLQQGPLVTLQIVLTRNAGQATITAGPDGNFADVNVLQGFPADLRPQGPKYMTFVRNGVTLGSYRVDTVGVAAITDMYPTATLAAGAQITLQGTYALQGA